MVAMKQGIKPVCYANKMKTPGKKSMDQTWHRTFFRTSSSPKTPQKDRSFWGVFVAKGKASDIPLPSRGLQRNGSNQKGKDLRLMNDATLTR